MTTASFDDLSLAPSDASDTYSAYSNSSAGNGSHASGGSQSPGPAAAVETVTKDSFGQNKYEDKAVDEDDWEFPSDDEQYEVDLKELREGSARMDPNASQISDLIRRGLPNDPEAHLSHAHVGGWSAADHHPKAVHSSALPVKPGLTYEITNLPLDDWGYFAIRIDKTKIKRMVITLTRLRDDCDPCLFVRRGLRPTQQKYDKCSYQTWSESERQHVVELDELRVDTYFIGVWNTPIFGRHDAAFTIKCEVEVARPIPSWVDGTEKTCAALRSLDGPLTQLERTLRAESLGFSTGIAAVREAVTKAVEEACRPGTELAEQLDLTEKEKARRRVPDDVRRWVFAPKGRAEGDDGGLFGAMESDSD